MSLHKDAEQTTHFILARIPANIRAQLAKYLEHKRLKARPTSVRNVAQMLGRFHDFFPGQDPTTLSHDACVRTSRPIAFERGVLHLSHGPAMKSKSE